MSRKGDCRNIGTKSSSPDVCDMARPDALSVVAATARVPGNTNAAFRFQIDSFAVTGSLFAATVWLLL